MEGNPDWNFYQTYEKMCWTALDHAVQAHALVVHTLAVPDHAVRVHAGQLVRKHDGFDD